MYANNNTAAGQTSAANFSDYAETHEVFNQPTPLEPYNAFSSDTALQYWIEKYNGGWGNQKLTVYGEKVGGELVQPGFQANRYKPEFRSHDRFGHRIDQVDYHPAYHQLMATAIEAGHHSLPWTDPKPGAHVVRAGLYYLQYQADPGTSCPLTMTFAAVPALRHQPDIAAQWLPKITANHYDYRNVPYFQKQGLTIGMAMTEKQGGSDVRANTTRAYPIAAAGPGNAYEIVGHKWFCSAPMCDAFLVLARTDAGLSCFLLPRWRPDGSKNQLYIQRLKDKMGNLSNASSEVEYRGALAWMIGEEGRGVRTILEMVAMTRFDCMIGSAAIMRQAVAQALHHTGGRSVFGTNLHRQPLMKNVLADLVLESEAALAITMQIASALDSQPNDEDYLHNRRFCRIATAIGKYWICKRTAAVVTEAMECIGAVGLIEDNVLARLYREAPVNAIWEGSGNVQCLDVLRALAREPDTRKAFFDELGRASGKNAHLDKYTADLAAELETADNQEFRARTLVEKMALAWQASVLLDRGKPVVAEAFITARLTGFGGHQFGTLPATVDTDALLQRGLPKLNGQRKNSNNGTL